MSGADDKTLGLKTAIEQAHDPAVDVPGSMDGEQLALMPLRNADEGLEARKRNEAATRGPGRPPGAKNKRTQDWVDYLLSKHPSPLEGLAAIAFRPVGDLARELLYEANGEMDKGLTFERVVELLKIQLGAMKELAPYLHQKQPQAITMDEGGLINLYLGDFGGQVKAKEAQEFDIEILTSESQRNQGVSEGDCEKSDVNQSDVIDVSEGERVSEPEKHTDHVSDGGDDA